MFPSAVDAASAAGRAAQRMGEIQGIEPCTIHRLLGYQHRGSSSDSSGSGGSSSGAGLELDSAGDEAGLGAAGAFTYHK